MDVGTVRRPCRGWRSALRLRLRPARTGNGSVKPWGPTPRLWLRWRVGFAVLVVDCGDYFVLCAGREEKRMIQIFDATMSGIGGKAQFLGSVKGLGYITAWGFAPFWVGQSRQALENRQTTPAGGFNVEVRDGIYVNVNPAVGTASPSEQPVFLPWTGDIWVLNGGGALDQPVNVAFVLAIQPPC